LKSSLNLHGAELCSASLLQEAIRLLAKLTMHTNRHPIAAPLALDGQMQAENNETITALIGAARAGDLTAISRLLSLGEVAARPAAQTSTASVSLLVLFTCQHPSESDCLETKGCSSSACHLWATDVTAHPSINRVCAACWHPACGVIAARAPTGQLHACCDGYC